MKCKCKNCGKEFEGRTDRKYCSRECGWEAKKKEKVLVKCAECGKEEYVSPHRAKTYVCCSKDCQSKYISKKQSQKIKCICPICKKEFYLKQYQYYISKTHCCSRECCDKLKETLYLGKNNHQYGLKGELNSSFKGKYVYTSSSNGHLVNVEVYVPDCPVCDSRGRVKLHRLIVMENWEYFPQEYFEEKDGWHILKKGYIVHHKDWNHSNNDLSNLTIMSTTEHTKLHQKIYNNDHKKYREIIKLLKENSNDINGILKIIDTDINENII